LTETEYYTTPNSNPRPDPFRPPPYTGPHGELGNVGRNLLRSWWIIVLCGIVALGVGLGVTSGTASSYEGTAYVLLNDNDFQQAVAGASAPVNTQTAQATAIDMLTPERETLAAQAAGMRASGNYTIGITAASNSNVLRVNATTGDGRRAAALANAAAQQLIAAVKNANANSLSGARAVVQAQLAAAKPGQKEKLAAQLNSFSTLEQLADQSVELIQPATVPEMPSGPSKARNGAIALVLGLILGCAFALLRPGRADLRRQ
jgi:uncharacterized protein involved in exopolysaccharide biosynthesis